VQPTAYLRQIMAKLTLGFKAFSSKHVKRGFHDPSCVEGSEEEKLEESDEEVRERGLGFKLNVSPDASR
jgi:hypothetical protein